MTPWRQLGINQEAHGSAGDQNRIGFNSRVFQTGADVLGFQVGVIDEDLGFVQTGGQQFVHKGTDPFQTEANLLAAGSPPQGFS